MYAMVEIKGKQYKAEEGALLRVEKVQAQAGDVVEFNSVLMIRKDDDIQLGSPYVKGASLKAVVEDHGREKKIIVFKYKRRKNYKRKYGHRQAYSLLRVKEIAGA